jgi:hypothetical protein
MQNKTKKLLLQIAFSTILVGSTISVFAMPEPRYLAVRDFDQCLESRSIGSERLWCMPDIRPSYCPRSSWYQLQDITEEDGIPSCRGFDHDRYRYRHEYYEESYYYPPPPPPPPQPVVWVEPMVWPIFDIQIGGGGHYHHHWH